MISKAEKPRSASRLLLCTAVCEPVRRVAALDVPASLLGSEDWPELRREDEALALALDERKAAGLAGAEGGIMVLVDDVGMLMAAKE